MSIYIKMTVSFIYYIIIHYWSNDCSGHWSTVNSLSCSWKVWFRWFQFHDIMCATRRWAHWSLWDKYGQCTRLVQLLLRGPKKISHTTSSWSINKKQYGSTLSCCLQQLVTLPNVTTENEDSSLATFFQTSTVQLWWVLANCRLSFLFLADKNYTQCSLLSCGSSALRFTVLFIHRCSV